MFFGFLIKVLKLLIVFGKIKCFGNFLIKFCLLNIIVVFLVLSFNLVINVENCLIFL